MDSAVYLTAPFVTDTHLSVLDGSPGSAPDGGVAVARSATVMIAIRTRVPPGEFKTRIGILYDQNASGSCENETNGQPSHFAFGPQCRFPTATIKA
jgi:hypothetical protein